MRLTLRLGGLMLALFCLPALASENTWKTNPYVNPQFDYTGDKLKSAWSGLHTADQEPFPSAERFRKMLADQPKISDTIERFDGDYQALATKLQTGWRHYHQGEYKKAYEIAHPLGIPGAYLASLALGYQATYLIEKKSDRAKFLKPDVDRMENWIESIQPNDTNFYYGATYITGRYAQSISIPKALTRGYGGKIKKMLDTILKNNPDHAGAILGNGSYHAEIVGKVGGILARMTYGAKRESALKNYHLALKKVTNTIGLYTEAAKGLVVLDKKDFRDQAIEWFQSALALTPRSPSEKLEQEDARSQLNSLTKS